LTIRPNLSFRTQWTSSKAAVTQSRALSSLIGLKISLSLIVARSNAPVSMNLRNFGTGKTASGNIYETSNERDTKVATSFDNWVFQQANADGVLRPDLDKWSGQTRSHWFPYVRGVAAEHKRIAVRCRDAADRRCTRFVIDKTRRRALSRATVAGER
jgi:hypothetical protein